MQPDKEFLFTYGTLMSRFDNPFAKRLRTSSTFVGEGYLTGVLYRISWYPGAVYVEGDENQVFGEIYRLDNATRLLAELDDYEDVKAEESESLYLRKLVPIIVADQSVLTCWTYLYNQPLEGLSPIPGGRFEHE